MKTWLITGGAGFIGSNFLRASYQKTDVNFVILDALTYAGSLTRIEEPLNSPRVKFIKGNICDEKLVTNIFREYSISNVIHFAAESHVDRSISNSSPFIETNIKGTFVLLEAARREWPSCGDNLFLHISTDEVFGDLGRCDSPFSESSPYRPSSPYSASKAAADHIVFSWYRTYGLPVIITNCSNNYGQWQYPEKLIPLAIVNLMKNREVPIYGDGLQIRDWIHVEDHCDALLSIIQKGKIGERYVIGGNNERTNVDVIQTICDAVDKIMKRQEGASRNLLVNVPDRLGHDRRYAIDSTKMRGELGWYPRRNFESALLELVQWHIDHKNWLNGLHS